MREHLTEEDDRGLEDATANVAMRVEVAVGPPFLYLGRVVRGTALHTGDPVAVAVQLGDGVLGETGCLVKAVDVLGDTTDQPSRLPQVGDSEVGCVRLGVSEHLGKAPLPRADRAAGVTNIAIELEILGGQLGPDAVGAPKSGRPDSVEIPAPVKHQDPLGVEQEASCVCEVLTHNPIRYQSPLQEAKVSKALGDGSTPPPAQTSFPEPPRHAAT